MSNERMKSIYIWLLLISSLMAKPESRVVDGIHYWILSAEPGQIRVVWKDAQQRQIKTFPAAVAHLRARHEPPLAIMNGGIYEPGGIPSGLLIQEGKEWQPVNRRQGEGNFFLMPNGIFFVTAERARVVPTDDFGPQESPVLQAVQSGPLLLSKGKIHPAFRAESRHRLHRNGIGVTREGTVLLIMTDRRSAKFPNLHEFATLFRTLGCDEALFLDGDISQFRHGADLDRASGDFGSFIAVVAPPAE